MIGASQIDEIYQGLVVANTYKIVSLLGRGGMGTVWAAEHARLPGKKVAVKVLHPEICADEEALARFRQEAEITGRLGHRNIVDVHDFNELPNGSPYIVLEFLEGESLAERLKRGPIAVEQAFSIIRQVASALSVVHQQEIVHRDLKPQNIFLCRSEAEGLAYGQVKAWTLGSPKSVIPKP